MIKHGFSKSKHDSCVYFARLLDNSFIYLLIYVDDMLIACKNMSEIQKLKEQLNSEFDMKDLGSVRKILGMDIHRDRGKRLLTISQSSYLDKVI